jgi:hypothetical protein
LSVWLDHFWSSHCPFWLRILHTKNPPSN